MNGGIHVLVAGDEGIAPGAFVTIGSLLTSCSDPGNVKIHFLDTGLKDGTRCGLEKLVGELGADIRFHAVDLSPFQVMNAYRGNYSTYARLLVQRYVPADRVVYVDTDFLVLKDIGELFHADMGECVVWAPSTPMIPTLADDCPFLHADEIREEPYFNAGLMLLDLRKWREQGCENAILEVLRSGLPLRHHDQTVLNFVLRGKCRLLTSDWGLLMCHDTDTPLQTNFHFGGGGVKPWAWGCHYSAVPLWWAYYDGQTRRFFRFSKEGFIKAYSLVLLWGAQLVSQMPFVPRLLFGAEKAKRMGERARHFGLMRKAACTIAARL